MTPNFGCCCGDTNWFAAVQAVASFQWYGYWGFIDNVESCSGGSIAPNPRYLERLTGTSYDWVQYVPNPNGNGMWVYLAEGHFEAGSLTRINQYTGNEESSLDQWGNANYSSGRNVLGEIANPGGGGETVFTGGANGWVYTGNVSEDPDSPGYGIPVYEQIGTLGQQQLWISGHNVIRTYDVITNTFMGYADEDNFMENGVTRFIIKNYKFGDLLRVPYSEDQFHASGEALCAYADIDQMRAELVAMVAPENTASRPWGVVNPSVVSFWRNLWTVRYTDGVGTMEITKTSAVNPLVAGFYTLYIGETDLVSYRAGFYQAGGSPNAAYGCMKSVFYDLRRYDWYPATFTGCTNPGILPTLGTKVVKVEASFLITEFTSDALNQAQYIQETRFGVPHV